MYLIGFAAAWYLGRVRARGRGDWDAQQVSDLIFYGALGAVLGGRLGYILFYDLSSTIADPLSVFRIWQGGMSFHGGLIGVLVATWLFARRHDKRFFQVT